MLWKPPTVTAPLLWPSLPSLDTCVRFSALKVWIPPSVFANRSPSTKQTRACMVLFLWLQTSHKFWNSSTVNFHILHRTLWPSDSALHHLVRPLVKIQGLGLWHNIFSWSVHSWHSLGLAYWNGRFHPAQVTWSPSDTEANQIIHPLDHIPRVYVGENRLKCIPDNTHTS